MPNKVAVFVRTPRKKQGGNRAPQRQGTGGALGPRAPRLQRNEVIERGIPGFRMLEYRTKLFYFDFGLTISTGAGSAGTRVYSTNGCFDPDITGTGHQPMSFDQMMLSFEHYVVHSAKMECSFRNSSTTNTMGAAISLNASPTPTTAIQPLVENGTMARTRLGMYPHVNSMELLEQSCDVAKFGGVRDLLDNPSYEGSAAANPTEQSYFHLSVWNPDSVSSVDCLIEVYLTFDVTFREPRKNSISLEQLALERAQLNRARRSPFSRREENASTTM